MSLQICPKCKNVNPYRKIYRFINFNRFDTRTKIPCDFCSLEMEVDYDIKNKRKMYYVGMTWMALPIAIIFLAYFQKITYTMAFTTVIAFHFGAMYYLIKKMNYKST